MKASLSFSYLATQRLVPGYRIRFKFLDMADNGATNGKDSREVGEMRNGFG